jgi:hypothetical protein
VPTGVRANWPHGLKNAGSRRNPAQAIVRVRTDLVRKAQRVRQQQKTGPKKGAGQANPKKSFY